MKILDYFRKFKWAYSLYNIFNWKGLKHNIPLYRKYGIEKLYFQSISSKDFKHLDFLPTTYDRIDSKLHLPEVEAFKVLNKSVQNALLPWSDNGFVILNDFFSEDRIDLVNSEVERLEREGKTKWKYGRIMFAIHESETLYDIATDDQLQKILGLLLDKEVELFQSLNFIKGSQQRSHSDSIHMTTFPYGNLIAAWIALEDITEENGPLHYYPGSHKLPYIMNEDLGNQGNSLMLGQKDYSSYEDKIEELIRDSGLEKKIFLANKGDVFIWHANLIHGGEKLKDPSSTRKSMVLHYYSKDAICFHEITQRPSIRRAHTK